MTALTPYEGTKNYIFVSYSHKDRKRVLEILDVLNKEGFRIWYDEGIEWGSEWPASIAKHLHDCSVLMAFHSKTSAVSTNCRQEINYALKYQKSIISVYLEDVELDQGVDMQLTLYQSTYPFQYSNIDLFYSRLVATPLLQCCRNDTATYYSSTEKGLSLNENETIANDKPGSSISNIDRELSEKFEEFRSKSDSNETALEKRVSQVKSKRFIKSLESALSSHEIDQRREEHAAISLIPIDYERKNGGTITAGKHFSIPNLPGGKRILFEVYRGIDYKTLTKYYFPEPLDSVEQTADDGKTVTLFFVDDPIPEGNQIIILDFFPQTNDAYINNGVLLDNELMITKAPAHMALKSFSSKNDDSSICLINAAYDLVDITDSQEDKKDGTQASDEMRWYDADIMQNPVIIIDPEKAQPVRREIYHDERTGEDKARIKLVPNKSYFAFHVTPQEGIKDSVPLSEREIASFYYAGEYGFPKDVFQAISHYEKDGSADSLYDIAAIFRTDETLLDEDTYLEYLIKAADMGSEGATIELSLQYCMRGDSSAREKGKELLKELAAKNSAIGSFVLGFLTETGILSGDAGNAFDYYLDAAKCSYKPALARLCCNREDLNEKNKLRQYYIETLENGKSIANYCIGCIYFFGLGVSPNKAKGIEFLVDAANHGNEMAITALFKVFDYDPEYQDKKKALMWLKEIEKFDSSVDIELAVRLLDGIGCEINETNDLLALSLLKKGANAGNETAIHNLGWMKKEGRGCEVDYELARELFEKAKRPNSYYQLGLMYEKGLGCSADMSLAIEYYKKGAEMGSKKAKDRIENIKEQGS